MKNVGSQRPTNSKEFTENYSAMKKAIEKVDSLAKRLIAGGSENSKARHVKRGKMLPRDRVANLLAQLLSATTFAYVTVLFLLVKKSSHASLNA